MNPDLTTNPLVPEIRRIVQRIALMSHVDAAQFGRNSKSTDDDIGGRRPSGGIDRKGDFEAGYRQKSDIYFQRKLEHCQNERQLEDLLGEAREALDAWRRTVIPKGQPPLRDDPQWKRWVAESSKDAGELARLFNCSRQYIHEVRKKYEGRRAA